MPHQVNYNYTLEYKTVIRLEMETMTRKTNEDTINIL